MTELNKTETKRAVQTLCGNPEPVGVPAPAKESVPFPKSLKRTVYFPSHSRPSRKATRTRKLATKDGGAGGVNLAAREV